MSPTFPTKEFTWAKPPELPRWVGAYNNEVIQKYRGALGRQVEIEIKSKSLKLVVHYLREHTGLQF